MLPSSSTRGLSGSHSRTEAGSGQSFDDALKAGRFPTKLAERLRGRLVFYECFAAGRTTNLLLKKFGSWCRSQRLVEDLAPEECELKVALKQRASSAEPIGISPKFIGDLVYFHRWSMRDKRVGKKEGGVGGVLTSANGTYVQHFWHADTSSVDGSSYELPSHPVHEVEVLPVLISFCVWSFSLVDPRYSVKLTMTLVVCFDERG